MSLAHDFNRGIWKENAVFKLLLGLCPVLAVTTSAENGLGMGLATTFVLVCSNAVVAMMRHLIPDKVRIPCFILIIASFVTVVQLTMEAYAYEYCSESIRTLGLEMHLFAVESNFEGSKLTFFFTADGRVDFRKLVKMLVKQFRSKIEMRQVGIRNQAKMCGGIGRCGRQLCCSSFLVKFDPVTIRMAKKQGLSLNPTKISGVCGRLMCCLTFESDYYEKKKRDKSSLTDTITEET